LGEFGWEIATWVPAVRSLANGWEQVVIICCTGHDYLYSGFDSKHVRFVHDDRTGRPDRWLLDGKKVHPLERYPDCHVVSPTEAICMDSPRRYRRYGKLIEPRYDIVFHVRAETRYHSKKRNWPVEKFAEVRSEFAGLRICCIGTCAKDVPGTDDKRNIPLADLCDLLASAKVLLSPSSGPAHLASYCGCPHVVMTDYKYQKQIRATNRSRYERLWNPFNTPCTVLDEDNWQPSVKTVCRTLEKYL
jgi:hypothetical protein